MESKKKVFTAYRYILVLYTICFTLFLLALLPLLAGYEVSVVNSNTSAFKGSLVVTEYVSGEHRYLYKIPYIGYVVGYVKSMIVPILSLSLFLFFLTLLFNDKKKK
ncbi:hypothetical protein ACU3L3_20370 [Priestia endophytica]|jgi:hypothetical protein|uniref:Uncharacterized protein n=1 Tax=Priestia endophytica DSM 13796 TaxID=1121089 RepID=A0A1I5Y7L1_9BACI|nr:hypothetical protein [Priestia endophytica]KAB2496001.1 hypothetical protein F8155_00075 [Priestia endophytica]KYG31612.1 hypothetical protein AZF06_07705 [Priestia endophytica]MBG9811526.1 hypothetical protein [Priestia endophytica]RAS82677.1 hypothetical protein A4R27_08405 [Priestia endophytica]SFQ40164.1 hypothetical protein SAMN02745910_01294 [Priestia endophytica DSM 13796]